MGCDAVYFDKCDIDFSEEPLYQMTWRHVPGCTNVHASPVPNSNVSDSPESVWKPETSKFVKIKFL